MDPQHPDKARLLNNLADLYYNQGRYADAEPLCREVLALLKQQLGDRHPIVAKKTNDLAYLVEQQGRPTEAEPIYRQALAIYQQLTSDRHLDDLVVSLNNAVNLLIQQQRYADAEQVYLEMLTSVGERFATHPTVITLRSMFALLVMEALKLGKVTQLSGHPITQAALQQWLTQIQAHSGEKHLGLAAGLNNGAEYYRLHQGYGQAETLYLEALAIVQALLEGDNPTLQSAWQNLFLFVAEVQLANHLSDLSDHPVTKVLLEAIFLDLNSGRILQYHYRQLADSLNQPPLVLATCVGEVAEFYRLRGHYRQAEALYIQAVTITEDWVGQENPAFDRAFSQFIYFLREVKQADRLGELLGHPVTLTLLNSIFLNP